MSGSDVHDMKYYQKCMVGGILSCGITHTIVCPLDIVKCRMQVCISLLLSADGGSHLTAHLNHKSNCLY